MPDIVCDIRDFWMLDFAERLPIEIILSSIMPTVDARPQARQWIATYEELMPVYHILIGPVVFCDQSGGKINYIGCLHLLTLRINL